MTKSDPRITQNEYFRQEAGTCYPSQGNIDYAVTTKNNQGFIFFENGNHVTKNDGTSMELCGKNITDEKTPAKTIDAVNGDIHIRARNGTIILEAANIRIIGADGNVTNGEVTITSSKIVNINTPTLGAVTTNTNIAASNSANIAGGTFAGVGAVGAEVVSGVDSDKSSLIGKLLQAITKFKKFFDSICSDK